MYDDRRPYDRDGLDDDPPEVPRTTATAYHWPATIVDYSFIPFGRGTFDQQQRAAPSPVVAVATMPSSLLSLHHRALATPPLGGNEKGKGNPQLDQDFAGFYGKKLSVHVRGGEVFCAWRLWREFRSSTARTHRFQRQSCFTTDWPERRPRTCRTIPRTVPDRRRCATDWVARCTTWQSLAHGSAPTVCRDRRG